MKDDIDLFREDIVFSSVLRGQSLTIHSTWGLFSPDHVDDGSRLLIEEMEVGPKDEVLDLGCGYGVIGLTAAKLAAAGNVEMVDKDFVAVDYANKNAEINGLGNCRAHLSNAFSKIQKNKKFDVILSNIPAKVGNEMLSLIVHDAHEHLKSNGRLYIVAVAGLREFLKRKFNDTFGNYEKLRQSKTYAVVLAVKKTR